MTEAVEDLDGVTHAVVLQHEFRLAGVTACGNRFWVGLLGPPDLFFGFGASARRMAASQRSVDCMSCLVSLPAYDEACTDGSPPTSGTA